MRLGNVFHLAKFHENGVSIFRTVARTIAIAKIFKDLHIYRNILRLLRETF